MDSILLEIHKKMLIVDRFLDSQAHGFFKNLLVTPAVQFETKYLYLVCFLQ
jgi:hypothetical protein